MHVGRENSLHAIGFSCLIVLEHGAETRTALYLHHAERVEYYTGASLSFGIDKLHIKLSMTVLCCLNIKLYSKFLCGRYHTFHLGIVVRVFIRQLQPFPIESDRCPFRRIDVPVCHISKL